MELLYKGMDSIVFLILVMVIFIIIKLVFLGYVDLG